MGNARILDISAAEYHADPCRTPSLSQSLAHVLLTKSPMHARLEHPKLGNRRRPPTKENETGSLVHRMLLGKGPKIVGVEAKDWRTKAAKEQREEIRAAGDLPVLEEDLVELETIVDVLRARLKEDYGVGLTGLAEVVIVWEETATDGTVVQCRGMLDHLDYDSAEVLDLKTITSADPKTCARHTEDFGYHLQRAAYTSAVRKLRPDLAGRETYRLLFCEIEEPYAVSPAELGGSMRELGERRWQRAVDLWGRCLKENRWPAYVAPGKHLVLEASPWRMAEEIGAGA